MSEWENTSLGELITYKKGYAFKSSLYDINGEETIVRVSDTTENSININSCNKIKTENVIGLDDYRLNTNDIVIATVGSWADNPNSIVGKVIKVPCFAHNALLNQNAVRLRGIHDKIKQNFLYYILKNEDFSSYLLLAAQGSANQASITLKDIFGYLFNLPPLPEQQAIASVLSALDDKIDLLQRQNQTLEQMAATLFRQWFIEEAKEDWEKDSFLRWIENTKGGDWGKEEPNGDFQKAVFCLRGTDIADLKQGLPVSTPLRFIKLKKFEAIEPDVGDIVIEISGGTENQSTGRCFYINEDVCKLFSEPLIFSNFCRLLKIRDYRYSYFVYLYLNYLYDNDEFFQFENGSSGIKNLNYKFLLQEQKYVMPSIDMVLQFNLLVSNFFNKINKNKFQIRTLKSLRDTLLPKLISGEVRLKGFAEKVDGLQDAS